eukprot:COSAG01_NODE_202_length_22130_cov_167.927239_21_plen_2422_part_01
MGAAASQFARARGVAVAVIFAAAAAAAAWHRTARAGGKRRALLRYPSAVPACHQQQDYAAAAANHGGTAALVAANGARRPSTPARERVTRRWIWGPLLPGRAAAESRLQAGHGGPGGARVKCVDRVEVLRAVLHSGGDAGAEALSEVLEHGVAVLEALRISTPRRRRKVMTVTSERIEEVLDTMDESGLIAELSSCEESSLAVLCERLCAVEALRGGEGADTDTESVLACVESLLAELGRCGDPVTRATGQLASADAGQRLQGLSVLGALSRVASDVACDAEVACVAVAVDMLSKEGGRSVGERTAAALALFTLCMRNTTMPADVSKLVKLVLCTYKEWGTATQFDIEAASALSSASFTMSTLGIDMLPRLDATQSETRALTEKYFKLLTGPDGLRSPEFVSLVSAERCEQLLPNMIECMSGTDTIVAAAACHGFGVFAGYAKAQLSTLMMVPSVLEPIVSAVHSIWDPQKDASWWRKRCSTVNIDTMGLSAFLMLPFQLASRINQVPAIVDAQWNELVHMSIELAKVNQKAQLSAQVLMPTMVFWLAFRLIAKQAGFEPKRKELLAPGLVEALLYTSVHDSPEVLNGLSTAAPAAAAAVQLIGRNEGGLTLSRGAAYAVLNAFGNFFDPSKRLFSALASRALGDCQSITHMVVSDANKAFIVEHPTAIDNLVSGLLLEEDNPRRTQPGAAELQHACALALQNLALSDVGARRLRSCERVMEALHQLAEGGMTDGARRCASGALFELEEERRQTEAMSVAAEEHIMLSYNWDHQDVIKRIHTSLVRRGYTTWIDVEKMQGSAVDAMADAVEGAAVMCYGVSRAYKESANCRLEAQYAYQREKDMVPLMVEEGYRADGWLGMLMGTRMYYVFYGSTLSSEVAFEGKMEELCRELGDCGFGSGPKLDTGCLQDVASIVDVLQCGAEKSAKALTAFLGHWMDVLEAFAMTTPRRGRKTVDAVCDRIEVALENVGDLARELADGDEEMLRPLSEHLCSLGTLQVGEVGVEYVGMVVTTLDQLMQCADPVAVAVRSLESLESSVRERGLGVLAALPRVVMQEVMVAEVAAAATVCEMVNVGGEKKCISAWLAVFALCFRNGAEASASVLGSDTLLAVSVDLASTVCVVEPVDGKKSVMLVSSVVSVQWCLCWELCSKSTGPTRAALQRQFLTFYSQYPRAVPYSVYSGERTRQLLPLLLETMTNDDHVVASGVGGMAVFNLPLHTDTDTIEQLLAPAVLDAILQLRSRVAGPPRQTTAEWWNACAELRSLETLNLTGLWTLLVYYAFAYSDGRGIQAAVVPHLKEIMSEAVHIALMIRAAELTQRIRQLCVHCAPCMATRTLAIMSSIPSQQQVLVSSEGLVQALLYIAEHDCSLCELSTAAFASIAAVNLIGRNEGGLILTRPAVDAVISHFESHFDPLSRRSKYPVKRMLAETKVLEHLIVPDSTKTYVVEHAGTLDGLVSGLLLEELDPRRHQEGAAELQQVCAMVLQNLALSPIGAEPLRNHVRAMAALRQLASPSSGTAKSEAARHSASGALFELEEETRQAVLAARKPVTAIEHLMLSYNWDHQDIIKRIHTSLVRRGYTTWIDVEKMQGSTVEAMADAVEGAAVMCYGVSRAYKESANCRLEAQYAYQREKDMVPLMVEEEYRADGWLGMLMGTRMYYVFYGSTLSSEVAFEGKMEELCRELGERGRAGYSDMVLQDGNDLLSALQSGCTEGAAALESILEHGLAVLDELGTSTPRRGRKQVFVLCDRVEAVLEDMDDKGGLQLATCEISGLSDLCTAAQAVTKLRVGEGSTKTLQVVMEVLNCLENCCDKVASSSRMLESRDVDVRLRGLCMLKTMAREVLDAPSDVEVSAASVVVIIASNGEETRQYDVAEVTAAFMAVFVLCFRNGEHAFEPLILANAAAVALWARLQCSQLANREIMGLLVAASTTISLLWNEIGGKTQNVDLRRRAEKIWEEKTLAVRSVEYSEKGVRLFMPRLIEALTDDDDVIASSASFFCTLWYRACCISFITAHPGLASTQQVNPVADAFQSPEMMAAHLALCRRLGPRSIGCEQPVSWWIERWDKINLDTLNMCSSVLFARNMSSYSLWLPTFVVARNEALQDAIYMAKINQAAELSAQPTNGSVVFIMALQFITNCSRDKSLHSVLLSSKVLDSLLYTTANDYVYCAVSMANAAAIAAVNLIGCNEDGLTLTRDAVSVVLRGFMGYFDPTTRYGSAVARRMLPDAEAIVHMVVSDANKRFIIQHEGAIDALVEGLLLDEHNPRRCQNGAEKLQQTCSLALQNLALSPIGANALRSNHSAMQAMQTLASGGMTKEAQQCASGALFELEQDRRTRVAKVSEHIMLSYNWDHQDVIKRIHTSLVRRGYTTWIDVEKMQGSAVDAMADAVEGAAVMCYGVSRAYKESANCRLEAQYAYQREKD